MKNKRILKERGITLIALVVTIVVLLILAGVTINAVFSDSGIIKKAQDAQNKMDQAAQNDLDAINSLNEWLDNKTNGSTGGDDNPPTTSKISTLIGTVVDKNTKAEDAYGNKITIPKGFKVVAHGTEADSATYTYSGDNIPAVQDGIVIENGEDKNQFVWVPVGTINNKTGDSKGATSTITLGRYSDFTATNEAYTPVQSAEDYAKETVITANVKNKNYTIAKLELEDEKESTIKINKAIQLEGIFDNIKVIKTAAPEPVVKFSYKELTEFRSGNTATDSTAENATARDLKTFIETSLANGGYYIARFEASKNTTTNKIESKYDKTVLTSITQSNAAKLAREMYGEVKENNELVYASDLVNSYAWDTAIIFIQTYSTKTDASSYASKNKSPTNGQENTGLSTDKYCDIWDMSGNVSEWTTENANTSGTSYFHDVVSRGGCYYTGNEGANYYTSSRGIYDAPYSNSSYGLRPLLYVK